MNFYEGFTLDDLHTERNRIIEEIMRLIEIPFYSQVKSDTLSKLKRLSTKLLLVNDAIKLKNQVKGK